MANRGAGCASIALALLVVFVQHEAVVAFISNALRPLIVTARSSREPLSMGVPDDDSEQGKNGSGRRDFLNKAALGTTGTAASIGAGTFISFGLSGSNGGPPPAVAAEKANTGQPGGTTTPKVALWGFGNQNKLMAKYLYERKIPVVAVVSHHDNGEDYGTVSLDAWGDPIGVKTGVNIVAEEDGPSALASTNPDVCIMCTRSTIADIKPSMTVCAQAKVNVVTIAEELLDSWTSSPELSKELDKVFKANGVSFTGSGFIDGACCEMALALSSMMHKIDALEGSLQYNVDDYGTVLAAAHGVGLTKSQFEKEIVKKPQAKSYVYNSNEWFVSALGLTLVSTKEERKPTFATIPLKSESIGKTIPVGDCTGMKVIATTTTKEGVKIVGEQVGKCYEPGVDQDSCEWGFQGTPSGVKFSMASPPTPQMTNTATISRIPQIIDAEPGYITSDKLPIASYRHWA